MNFKTGGILQDISQNISLSTREKHLIGLAVTLTRGCDACTSRRFEEALNEGITEKELTELTDFVALTNAGVVIRTALLSIEQNKEKEDCGDVCTVK